jgi:hypothetical protein
VSHRRAANLFLDAACTSAMLHSVFSHQIPGLGTKCDEGYPKNSHLRTKLNFAIKLHSTSALLFSREHGQRNQYKVAQQNDKARHFETMQKKN